MPFLTLFWGSPAQIDYRTKGYPYSNLSTGGPRSDVCVCENELVVESSRVPCSNVQKVKHEAI